MRRIILALSALLVLALLAPMPAMAQAAQSWIRVMHDSPDAPNVDVFVDGAPVFENVAYSTTSNYQALASGPHRVQIAPAGKSVARRATTVAIVTFGPRLALFMGRGRRRCPGWAGRRFAEDWYESSWRRLRIRDRHDDLTSREIARAKLSGSSGDNPAGRRRRY